MRVNPTLQVMVLQLFDVQSAWQEIQKALTLAEIPVVGAVGTVKFAPLKERVEDFGSCVPDETLLGLHAHQLVIALERFGFVRAEIMLAAFESDVPHTTGLPVPRLGMLNRHLLKPFSIGEIEHQGELKGSRASRQVTLPGGFIIGLRSVATVTTSVTGQFSIDVSLSAP